MSEEDEVIVPAEFDFSAMELKSQTVKLPGDDKVYILKEASSGAVAAWRNAQMKGMTFDSSGKPQKTGDSTLLGDLQPLLVSKCLYHAGGKKPIEESVVRAIPERILSKLYDWVMDVSELNGAKAKKEEDLKN